MFVRLRTGRVVSIVDERSGLMRLRVEVEGVESEALAYTDLVVGVDVGHEVLLNTTAVELGLGTGGAHFVVATLGPGVSSGTDLDHPGHVMKARYTPLQAAVLSVEESHRDLVESSAGLAGTPVVAAPLHSMLAHICAGAKVTGGGRVVYVMTDGASLPGALSDLVPRLKGAGLLDGYVTCGQAFGGDLEAVTLWTALIAAREVLSADVVVVADGPGTLGTDTRWGSGNLHSGHAIDAAATLHGRAVAALRISFADHRERHRSVSHHSLTILRDVAHSEANVAVPSLEEPMRSQVWDSLRDAGLENRHQLVEVSGEPAMTALEGHGIEVASMGRSPADDPAFFLAAGAAGVLAGRMAAVSRKARPPSISGR
jgi:hypothetical protein